MVLCLAPQVQACPLTLKTCASSNISGFSPLSTCSALIQRPAYAAPAASRYGFAFDDTGYQPLEVNNETRVIRVDVSRDVFLAASCGSDGRIPNVPTNQTPSANGKHKLVYTTSRWREDNGEKFAAMKKAEWNRQAQAPEIINAMTYISLRQINFIPGDHLASALRAAPQRRFHWLLPS
ncbi:hypothetical protein MIR68_002091 [Amoeboaphelidium protococcarum]|nr:hypothetical protein MIR68_002091 [Amoeboaphelidium protococcarum]